MTYINESFFLAAITGIYLGRIFFVDVQFIPLNWAVLVAVMHKTFL